MHLVEGVVRGTGSRVQGGGGGDAPGVRIDKAKIAEVRGCQLRSEGLGDTG